MPWHCHAALHKPHSHGICCYDKRRPWHEDVYNLWCADACTCHLPVDAGAQTTRCFLRSKIKSMSHRCSNHYSMHFFRGEVKVCLQLSSKCTIMTKFTMPRMHNAGGWLPLNALRRITKQSATFGSSNEVLFGRYLAVQILRKAGGCHRQCRPKPPNKNLYASREL